jgi:hypothetical protein
MSRTTGKRHNRLFTRLSLMISLTAAIMAAVFGLLTLDSSSAHAIGTSQYRSAGWVATDGSSTPFSNTQNCQASDGAFCSHTTANGYANLYFSSFGTLADFGIPAGSDITKVHIKTTGKNSTELAIIAASIKNYMPFATSCSLTPNLWTISGSNTTKVQKFHTFTSGSGITSCFKANSIDQQKITFAVRYSGSNNWTADIDNFEIAFDYSAPFSSGPSWVVQPTGLALNNHQATALDSGNKVLITGGNQIGGSTNNVELYTVGPNHSGSMVSVQNMKVARLGHQLIPIAAGQKALAIGGHETSGTVHNTAEIYNLATNSWAYTGIMTSKRALHRASLLTDGKVFTSGGITSLTSSPPYTNTTEMYNPTTNSWTAKAPMSTARAEHQQVTFHDANNQERIMVIGGRPTNQLSATLSSTEIYNPSTDTWVAGPSMSKPRASAYNDFVALVMNDGRIMVLGGGQGTESEIYDPTTNGWSQQLMSGVFSRGAATPLDSNAGNKMLAAGSWISGGPTEYAMLYDSNTNTWGRTTYMNAPRADFALTTLIDGTVLATAGNTQGPNATTTNEVYVPSSSIEAIKRPPTILYVHGVKQSSDDQESFTALFDGISGRVPNVRIEKFTYFQDKSGEINGQCDPTHEGQQPINIPPNVGGMPLDLSQNDTHCDSQGDISQNAVKLNQKIQQLYIETGQKVILIGYSMGGETIRAFLASSTQAGDGVATTMVDSVVTMHGVMQGSWLSRPETATPAWFDYVADLILPFPDLSRTAVKQFNPVSDFLEWTILNSTQLPNIPYYNTWGDERTYVRHCPTPSTCYDEETTWGDVVLLPGNDILTDTTDGGGQRFLPRGYTTSSWQWAETLRIQGDITNPTQMPSLGSTLWHAPQQHTEYPKRQNEVMVTDCQTGAGVAISTQLAKVIHARLNGSLYECEPSLAPQ